MFSILSISLFFLHRNGDFSSFFCLGRLLFLGDAPSHSSYSNVFACLGSPSSVSSSFWHQPVCGVVVHSVHDCFFFVEYDFPRFAVAGGDARRPSKQSLILMFDVDVRLRPLEDALGLLDVLGCEPHLVSVDHRLVHAGSKRKVVRRLTSHPAAVHQAISYRPEDVRLSRVADTGYVQGVYFGHYFVAYSERVSRKLVDVKPWCMPHSSSMLRDWTMLQYLSLSRKKFAHVGDLLPDWCDFTLYVDACGCRRYDGVYVSGVFIEIVPLFAVLFLQYTMTSPKSVLLHFFIIFFTNSYLLSISSSPLLPLSHSLGCFAVSCLGIVFCPSVVMFPHATTLRTSASLIRYFARPYGLYTL
ncbi:unnamed protein product [Acanthosepion pharaonis]|uniref:Uncharacterized protein n=1 Tax=Acanthosepion pharaonis TaxID=158019 RepID=A0A812AQK8_ACAPH|nr:unnamed protein product [Sepia pharaonis]